jgi:NADPH:quinone reductase-like Zn-dependent oxidoreductase
MQIDQSPGGGLTLRAGQVPQPVAGEGDVLVRVLAAGVTPTELEWSPTTLQKNGEARLHAIPAHEFSGVIEAVGEGVSGFAAGQAVYGMNDWFAEGAMAEFCLAQPGSIAAKPATLTYEEAATVPIGALTAWQGLFDKGKLQPGEKVLIHGGAGSVGIFAVQLAHRHGAHVIATASTQTLSVVKGLGADEVIDYRKERFEEMVRDVDVVFDTVGGETLERSWSVMKPEGRMITVAADGETSSDPRIKQNYFIVEPNGERLGELAKLLDEGSLKTLVNAAVPLAEAAAAYARRVPQTLGYGKVVVTISGGA